MKCVHLWRTYAYTSDRFTRRSTVHHRAAMQSRTVAHSLRAEITDDGRQHPSVVPNDNVSGERERSFELSLRRIFGELHPGETCGRRVFPDEMTLGNTHVHVNDNICVRSLDRVL